MGFTRSNHKQSTIGKVSMTQVMGMQGLGKIITLYKHQQLQSHHIKGLGLTDKSP